MLAKGRTSDALSAISTRPLQRSARTPRKGATSPVVVARRRRAAPPPRAAAAVPSSAAAAARGRGSAHRKSQHWAGVRRLRTVKKRPQHGLCTPAVCGPHRARTPAAERACACTGRRIAHPHGSDKAAGPSRPMQPAQPAAVTHRTPEGIAAGAVLLHKNRRRRRLIAPLIAQNTRPRPLGHPAPARITSASTQARSDYLQMGDHGEVTARARRGHEAWHDHGVSCKDGRGRVTVRS